MGFAPTRSFTIDVADFHPSVDHVKALGGAAAFTAWICFGGPRVVSRSIPTEPNRVVGTCIREATPITDDVLFQTTFLFAADVLTLPVKDLDRAARGTFRPPDLRDRFVGSSGGVFLCAAAGYVRLSEMSGHWDCGK